VSSEVVNLVAVTPAGEYEIESWNAEADTPDLLREFDGWDPDLRSLMGQAERVGRWALLDRDPLSRWTRGRLTLLGDAAHPMIPFFAQGAAQALEDATALAAFVDATPTIEHALELYGSHRSPRANSVLEVSRGRQSHHHLQDGEAQRRRDAEFAGTDSLAESAWLYAHDARKEALAAMRVNQAAPSGRRGE
jgi:salicylate hydroxylase